MRSMTLLFKAALRNPEHQYRRRLCYLSACRIGLSSARVSVPSSQRCWSRKPNGAPRFLHCPLPPPPKTLQCFVSSPDASAWDTAPGVPDHLPCGHPFVVLCRSTPPLPPRVLHSTVFLGEETPGVAQDMRVHSEAAMLAWLAVRPFSVISEHHQGREEPGRPRKCVGSSDP